MPRFMTRHGLVTFRAKKTKAKTKKKAPKKKSTKKASKKTMSKKVGRWRVECRGRTVYAAGAKHAYKTPAAACAAYKKLTSVKSVEGFVGRYGKKKTKQAVVGGGKKKATKKKTTKRKNPCDSRRRNAPVSVKDAAVIKRILRKHGYR